MPRHRKRIPHRRSTAGGLGLSSRHRGWLLAKARRPIRRPRPAPGAVVLSARTARKPVVPTPEPKVRMTHRWRGMDSNFRSPVKRTTFSRLPKRIRQFRGKRLRIRWQPPEPRNRLCGSMLRAAPCNFSCPHKQQSSAGALDCAQGGECDLRVTRGKIEMEDWEIRAALDAHWAASDAARRATRLADRLVG